MAAGESMALEGGVVALVLLTAVLHASWNAVVKSSGDQLMAMTLVMGTGALAAGSLIPFVDLPERAASVRCWSHCSPRCSRARCSAAYRSWR